MFDDATSRERDRADGNRIPDSELLRRYATQKSEGAFAALVGRYVDMVYSAALRQVGGDAHRANDVAQEVFSTVARKAASLVHHPVLAGWLYTTTHLAAAKVRRTEVRRRAREHAAGIMNEASRENVAPPDWEAMRPVLDDAMRALGERDRQAVLLRYFAQRPFAEIGATLNLSEDGARMRVDRALEKLRALLGRRGVTSTSTALAAVLADHAVVAAPAGLAAAVTGAATTGGAAAAAGVLAFMSIGKIAVTVVIVAGVAAIGLGLREHARAEEAAAASAAVSRNRDELQANLRQAEARLSVSEARSRDAEARLAAAAAPGGAAQVAVAGGNVAADDAAMRLMAEKAAKADAEKQALNKARATNPDMQRLMLQGERAGFALRYGPLYSRLNLSPEQVARFEDRLAAASENTVDIMAASLAKGLSPTDPAVQKLANQEQAAFAEDIRGIIGDAGYSEYQNYNRTQPAREQLNGLLGALVATGAPLSAEQVNELTQIVADHSVGYQQGGRVRNIPGDVDWRAVLNDAARVLAPTQLGAFRAMAMQSEITQKMREITDAMLAARPDAGAANAKRAKEMVGP